MKKKMLEVLDFWFEEIDTKLWWRSDPAFDRQLSARFSTLHRQAFAGELYDWRRSPSGRLAEVIVLDQFSRNLYRGSARAFAADNMALALAQEAVAQSDDQQLSARHRYFLYMPYMHSESARIHQIAEQLFSALGNEAGLKFELQHKSIIDRFGRYPHRNTILGRTSTPAELAFLQQPNSSF